MLHPKIVVESSHVMEFIPTVKERRANGLDKQNFIVEKIEDGIEKMYWMYYINLPYYLMLTADAYILHTFILTMFSLSVFGIVKYCLMF
ncbi:similar to Saccharomyces cerevisiae YBR058C-A TSC3 Protein that stimulates the activity of serine palmitoyltransferase (Lcb1p, Lcb2p) several-fold [Maudiozyma saulgeensis]|uniref:Similar to Saccharomyces cerevisiae YBR058C-A TSC3 Protein that stimulates the activity of serine palmitoyltransferase (Lcb1p, Lcb2p) several-fold n=1 Tax=Maudiozyma saulgeensis TaxID=1789683 RepID=A0A1X7R6M7_9SACH|nr:similar to Saccharomyces cerevisiae YBR058C-A TSC3 Protein that stimulates the activity of serine palmitoyltransferase (Lcb1p, Lcb2p) several-fold [Kazachstania saulgeensis]